MATIKALFARQRPTCPDSVETLIRDKMRGTISGKMEREDGVRQDRREAFTDDWTAVAGELEAQSSTNLQRCTPQWRETPNNLHLGPLPESQNTSQTAEASFDFGAASAAGLLRYRDSDSLSPDSSSEETVGRTLDPAVSPTPSCQLSLSLEILEPELEETVHSDQGTEQEGNGASV